LEAEGLFDAARKRPLPFLPAVIGVITSPTGAVIRDIIHRLADRFPSRVLVWPVLVQGQGAAEQVAAALAGFASLDPSGPIPRPDLLIVARGGGSIEDLWAFNEEVVVRAANGLDDLGLRQRKCASRPVAQGRERLAAQVRLLPRPEALAERPAQRLDELADRLRRGLADRAARARGELLADAARLSAPLLRSRVDRAGERLRAVRLSPALIMRPLTQRRERLAAVARLAEQLHPDRPLQRGYVRVMTPQGATVTTSAAARREPALTLKFGDGSVDVTPIGAARPPRAATRPGAPATTSVQPKLL
jgi:exodeoxyribonuclease VII large subunit